MRWTTRPSGCSEASVFYWSQLTARGVLGELLPALHKVLLDFCECLGGHPGWNLPTFREGKVQFNILSEGFDFILQRNKNRALQ